MEKIKKAFWFTLGVICIGIAYVGIVTPGIPWSTPTVMAAFCFARSSKRMENWLYNHKLFGPFLTNWGQKRVFPTKAKWAMFITMDCSLIIIWFTTGNWKAVAGTGLAMMLVSIWACRYPGSVEEWKHRIDNKLKVGWFK